MRRELDGDIDLLVGVEPGTEDISDSFSLSAAAMVNTSLFSVGQTLAILRCTEPTKRLPDARDEYVRPTGSHRF